MTVHLVQSTDAGAPAFTATPGGMVSVLDYVLVTKANWELAFSSGTTIRVYRPRVGMRHYLRVQDGIVGTTITGAACSDFETMTGASTGTNEMPGSTAADSHFQGANGSGPHAWVAVVDERTMTFLNKRPGAVYGYELLHWGDLRPRGPNPHRTVICARTDYFVYPGTGLGTRVTQAGYGWATPANAAGTFGPYRTGNLSPGVQNLSVWADPARGPVFSGAGVSVGKPETYPGLDGLGVLARIQLGDPTAVHHLGWCRGLWAVKNPASAVPADRTVGTGVEALAGRQFLFVRDLVNNDGVAVGVAALETSNTWDTAP